MGVNGIYGLSGSGLDIESMVKVGMMSKQSQYDKMYKTETKMSWQKEAYSTVYTDLTNFGMNKLTDYKLQSKMNAMAATSNNTSAFTVSANGSAVAMSHKVEVNELSSNAYLMSTKEINRIGTEAKSDSIYLKDSMFKSITGNGDLYNVTFADGATQTVSGSDVALKFTVDDGTSELSEGARTVTFTYKDIAEGKSFNDLASSIKNLGLNVTASYDSVNDSFSLYNSKGGSENTISLTMGNAAATTLFNNLNLGESKNGELNPLGSNATLSGTVSRANTEASESNALKDVMFQKIAAAPTLSGTTYAGMTETDDGNGVVTYSLFNEDKSVGAMVKKTTDAGTGDITYQISTDGGENWSASSADNPIGTSDADLAVTKADGTLAIVGKDAEAFSFEIGDGINTDTIRLTYGDLADGKSLDDLVSKINDSGLNVTASYENGKFSLVNSKTGLENKVSLKANDDGAATLLNQLGVASSMQSGGTVSADGGIFSEGETSTISGSNGKITVDGREYTSITDNRITVAGVTYTLLDKTSSAATVTVTQDTDAIVDRVKQFVEDYNSMLDDLQKKYTETKYSDYDVLTKSQEEAMTKEQVEKWNEKAKSGLLYHDKYIGDIISKMREALSTPVEGVSGKYNSAFNIGIRTSTDQGHIELDEDKLKSVLNEEPNSVYEVFGKLGAYDEKTKKYDYKASGVAQRLGDVINDGMKSIKSYAGTSTEADDGSTLGSKIMEWQNKMSDFKTKMSAFESLLYKKYDAMEVALQRLAMTLNYVSFNNG